MLQAEFPNCGVQTYEGCRGQVEKSSHGEPGSRERRAGIEPKPFNNHIREFKMSSETSHLGGPEALRLGPLGKHSASQPVSIPYYYVYCNSLFTLNIDHFQNK